MWPSETHCVPLFRLRQGRFAEAGALLISARAHQPDEETAVVGEAVGCELSGQGAKEGNRIRRANLFEDADGPPGL